MKNTITFIVSTFIIIVCLVAVANAGSSVLDGQDYELPEAQISGNSNNTNPNLNMQLLSDADDYPAVFFENQPADDIELDVMEDGAEYTGSELVAGSGGTSTWKAWEDYADSLIARDDTVVADETNGNSADLGDPLTNRSVADPQITYVPEDAKYAGTVEGSGILIVEEGAQFTGTFLFEGLVIVLTRNMEKDDDGFRDLDHFATGNSTIVGAIMVVGEDKVNLTVGGSSEIYYSSEALELAKQVSDFTTFSSTTTYSVTSWRQH